ncbi:hypothetical protein HCN44_000777 [Aphidius gifuensis]|uniref:Uncharacterized protein n=1 Tax=Aphidius gifuensis TaxID=684658 RepID=A0A834XR28_APHGI|nr:structural maintenance of chromosomes protein 1A-like [Aphidius gifuensis]KAF7990972.1 hypothetical protein HCN44_000777 [Aphidius gifuensis]
MSTKVTSIILFNFKSFYKLNYVDPPLWCEFMGIISENDSDRNDFIDAIKFVLGEKLSNFGYKSYADFMYKNSAGEKLQNDITFVSLTLLSPEGVTQDFARSIDDNKCTYIIDKEEYSDDEVYMDTLKKQFHIDIEKIQFHQGMVNTIINQSPIEMSKTFEELSKSIKFKQQYDNLKKEITICEAEISNLNDKIHPLLEQKDTLIRHAPGNKILCQLEEKFKERYYLFAIHQKEKCIKKIRDDRNHIWEKIQVISIAEIRNLLNKILKLKKTCELIAKPNGKLDANSIKIFNKLLESDAEGVDDIYDNLRIAPDKEYECKNYKENRLKLNEIVGIFIKEISDIKSFQGLQLIIEGGNFQLEERMDKIESLDVHAYETMVKFNQVLDLGTIYHKNHHTFLEGRTELFRQKGILIREAIDNNVESIGETLMKNIYKPIYEKREFDLDFSSLPDKLLNITDENEAEKMKNKLQENIDSVQKNIHKNAMTASKEKLDKLDNEMKIYVDKKTQMELQLENLYERFKISQLIRKEYFMKYLNSVEERINEVYASFTDKYDERVKIIINNENEPYLDGILFEFHGQLLSNLSKKNKIIAAISILFAQKLDSLKKSFLFINQLDNQLGEQHISCLMDYLGSTKLEHQIIFVQKYQQTKILRENAHTLIKIDRDEEGSLLRMRYI